MAVSAFIDRVNLLGEQLALVWAGAPDERFEVFLRECGERTKAEWPKAFRFLKPEDVADMTGHMFYQIRKRRRELEAAKDAPSVI